MALAGLPLALLLLATVFAASPVDTLDSFRYSPSKYRSDWLWRQQTSYKCEVRVKAPSGYFTVKMFAVILYLDNLQPDCTLYAIPACPRNLSPVCGSDMNTYGNECTLCMKIREANTPIEIVKDEPC